MSTKPQFIKKAAGPGNIGDWCPLEASLDFGLFGEQKFKQLETLWPPSGHASAIRTFDRGAAEVHVMDHLVLQVSAASRRAPSLFSAKGWPSTMTTTTSTKTELLNGNGRLRWEQTRCSSKVVLKQDKWKMRSTWSCTRSDGVQYRLEYEREAGDTETEYDIRFRCHALVEYIPAASTSAFNASTSTVVKTVPFNDNWSNFVGVTTSDPMTFTTWTGSASLNVLARFHVTQKLTDANNLTLTPNGVKVDYEVHNFPYQDGTNQSQLALVCTTASSVETDTDDSDDDDEYNGFQFYERGQPLLDGAPIHKDGAEERVGVRSDTKLMDHEVAELKAVRVDLL
eukprot:g23307.t1